MKIYKIPKKSGGFRKIIVPPYRQRKKLKAIAQELNTYQAVNCKKNIHGFMPSRSAISNAREHLGYKFTLCMDLKDFFESVSFDMVEEYFKNDWSFRYDIRHNCFFKDFLPQGFPTSPALANLSAIKMDEEISDYCNKNDIKYSRYADDLAFSSNDKNSLLYFRDYIVSGIITKNKFNINFKKTRMQWAGNNWEFKRIITGVAVGKNAIAITRKSRRKLRSAKHNNTKNKINGLEEWAKLKLPNEEKIRSLITEYVLKQIAD